ncbi:MAG: T9SS type A sorting domain-containing protein [Saprospiraceae bacterium]|nr:T9SS type A sorting domain-containing protein [Saprospiraceae bacterium]
MSPSLDIVGQNPALRFWHRFDTEIGADGGFLEISTDGGNVWQIIRDGFIKNGYNNDLSYSTFAIPALRGFTGSTNGEFIDSYLDLSPWKGQSVIVRFRFGSNETGSSAAVLKGWFIDDVEVMDLLVYDTEACIANSDNANGSCSEIKRIVIDSEGTVASEDINKLTNYTVYPNPANDYVVVDMVTDKGTDVVVSVVSASGSTMMTDSFRANEGRTVHSLSTHQLNPGMYFIRVQTGSGYGLHKLVIK